LESYRGQVTRTMLPDELDWEIRTRKQSTDIEKYFIVNRTIKLWKQGPAEGLATFLFLSHIFKKSVRKVIISEVK